MKQNNLSDKNTNNEIAKNFFIILIIKELIHKKYFEKYYITFLDIEGFFDIEKFELKLNEIYNLISNNDATCLRPNNSEIIGDETIKNIIMEYWDSYKWYNRFSEDLLTHIEWKTIQMDFKTWLKKKKINEIKKLITEFLVYYYKEAFFHKDVQITLEEIVKKIIDILKNNRYIKK